MANTSIGGLVSGLDTSSIINQLMQLEARPQTMLKTRMGAEQKAITSLQALNAKLASIATKAADLVKADQWSPTKATSDERQGQCGDHVWRNGWIPHLQGRRSSPQVHVRCTG